MGINRDKVKLDNLVQKCKQHGLKVVFTDSSKLYDYAGMHPEIAKDMGIKDYPKDTIWIDKNRPIKNQCIDLEHELIEYNKMKNGMDYWKAHTSTMRELDEI